MRKRPVWYAMLRKRDGRMEIIKWRGKCEPEGHHTRYMHSFSVGPFKTLWQARDYCAFAFPTRPTYYSGVTLEVK